MLPQKKDILNDLRSMDSKDFYKKYMVRSENWYFEKVLKIPDEKFINIYDEFRDIVSCNFNASFTNVLMVGSGKIGFSLSPKKDFKDFNTNSDLDIAIISSRIYEYFWQLFRKGYSLQYKADYEHIGNEIYRGYINERNLNKIPSCKEEWQNLSRNSSIQLKSQLFILNPPSYRIYRSWEDFEEYNILNINQLKTRL